MKQYNVLRLSTDRRVTLCGTNVYPNPEYHPDRIMQEHDLLYIYEGEQKVAQNDEVYTLRTGDLLFLRAGAHHYGPERCSINARTMFIHMTALPDDHVSSMSLSDAQGQMTGKTMCLPTLIHCGQEETVLKLFRKIIDAYWSHRPDAERVMSLAINTLLNELCYIAMTADEPEEEWSTEIIRMFRQHPERNYAIQDIAAMVGMSVRTLSKRFKDITGISIHQYQMNTKLESAYHALRSGSVTVKTVSERFGFCDPYYFSRAFKEKFGVSPSKLIGSAPGANINRPPVV